jgi:copper chaperone NosL
LAAGVLLLYCCSSCSVQAEEINYGKDACHFCKMAIVENKFGAEIVTQKGKVYKYDAIECMLNDIKKRDSKEIGLYLVTDYDNPKNLFDATRATFLVSKKVRSPMGGNLSAFEIKKSAEAVKKNMGGNLFNWKTIQKEFEN